MKPYACKVKPMTASLKIRITTWLSSMYSLGPVYWPPYPWTDPNLSPLPPLLDPSTTLSPGCQSPSFTPGACPALRCPALPCPVPQASRVDMAEAIYKLKGHKGRHLNNVLFEMLKRIAVTEAKHCICIASFLRHGTSQI